MNILCFDTETGGLEPGVHSLLTAYFALINPDTFELIDDLDLKVKPNDGKYNITPKAMEINGIDLEEHDKVAITYAEANKVLVKWLEGHKIKGKRNHFFPMGQNIGFDIDFIQATILSSEEYRKVGMYYGEMDTKNLVDFLKFIGIFPDHMKTNLGAIVEHLNLPKRKAHEAKDDVLMTVDVFRGLVNLFKERKDSASSLKTKLILDSVE
jgi:DNA polymerase III alpha subunit (gram-positive type)